MLVKVEAYHDGQFWCGRALRHDFFSQGKTLDELLKNVEEAASLHLEDQLRPGEALNLLLISETEVKRGKAAAS